jgi:phosphatidylglycerophosphate synthase
MSLPSYILCDPATALIRIAGLTVLDRLVITLHRAGCASITLVGSEAGLRLPRSEALNIPFRTVKRMPAFAEPSLVMRSGLLVQPHVIRHLMNEGGRLVSQSGTPLPLGVLSERPVSLEAALNALPEATARGLAEGFADAASARLAARALWSSVGSATDGLVDRWFNRPLGRLLFKWLVETPVTPNQVSFLATLLGLWSAWMFSQGTFAGMVKGAMILQFSAVIDCVDGDVARLACKESRLGGWLDIIGDQVVHLAVFGGIGVGLWRAGSDAPVVALTVSSVVGVILSFGVVLRGLLQPRLFKNSRLQRLIDATTNRDFSVLLIFLSFIGRVEIFLWLTAFGVHLFWILAWIIQRREQPATLPLPAGRENNA